MSYDYQATSAYDPSGGYSGYSGYDQSGNANTGYSAGGYDQSGYSGYDQSGQSTGYDASGGYSADGYSASSGYGDASGYNAASGGYSQDQSGYSGYSGYDNSGYSGYDQSGYNQSNATGGDSNAYSGYGGYSQPQDQQSGYQASGYDQQSAYGGYSASTDNSSYAGYSQSTDTGASSYAGYGQDAYSGYNGYDQQQTQQQQSADAYAGYGYQQPTADPVPAPAMASPPAPSAAAPASSDPFAAKQDVGAVTNSFNQMNMNSSQGASNPFASSQNTSDPFASSAQNASDPFAASSSQNASNPFASSSSQNASNPFASSSSQNASDPFASTGRKPSTSFDPRGFGGIPSATSDPFASNTRPGASGQFDSEKRQKALQLGGVSNQCGECGKPVFLAEEVRVMGKVLHKRCFKCSACGAPLSVSTFSTYENKAYCKAHHVQIMRASTVVKGVTLSESMLKVNMGHTRTHAHTDGPEEDDATPKVKEPSFGAAPAMGAAPAAPAPAAPSKPAAFEPDSNLQTQLPQKEPPEGVIQGLVVMLDSPDINTRAKAAAALCNITAASQKSVVSAADGAVIPQLVNMLKTPATQNARYLRAAAAGCLCNFAFNAENRAKINKAGAVPVLVSMLGPEDPFVSAHAAGALWSLLVGSEETKDLLASCGGFEPLVAMLSTGDTFAQSQAAGALSESCCKNARNKLLIGQSGAIPVILKLATNNQSPQLQRAAMLSLCNLLANCESNKTIAMKEGALTSVIDVLMEESIQSETVAAALGTIVNLPSTDPNRKLAKQKKLKARVTQLQSNSSASVQRNAEKVLRWLK